MFVREMSEQECLALVSSHRLGRLGCVKATSRMSFPSTMPMPANVSTAFRCLGERDALLG